MSSAEHTAHAHLATEHAGQDSAEEPHGASIHAQADPDAEPAYGGSEGGDDMDNGRRSI